ncbi:hypothetical protein [Cohnella lupini]|uniref:Uncharacterized protein n=1 Tax=Cohnella lupini TaxID=1294267 RepID=A0A3D9IXE2_9BACL|nr:hypothetical protein [Cohnella lupini]RED66179.1 hypothetical protein DFP95_101677 [Cohnella lupini]
MIRYRKYLIFIGIPLILIMLYGLTYIPHKIINMEPSKVSSIIIFNGDSGYETEISDKEAIQHIINNLNGITFQKDKWAFIYTGYSFKTTIFNNKGKPIRKLTINSSDTIRYKGFFYKTRGRQIDYEYIRNLIESLPKKVP